MIASEYEEEWEKCVELCLVDRGNAYMRAKELIFMPVARAERWHIPLSATLVFCDIIRSAMDEHSKTHDKGS